MRASERLSSCAACRSGIYTYDERAPTESDITDAELVLSGKLNLIATFGRR